MVQNVSLKRLRQYWDWKVYEEVNPWSKISKVVAMFFLFYDEVKKNNNNQQNISFINFHINIVRFVHYIQTKCYLLTNQNVKTQNNLETTQINLYNMTNIIQTGKIFLEIYGLLQDLRLYQIKLNLIKNIVLCS